jgi:TPR repeat protein
VIARAAKDYAQAMIWYRKAADQGNAEARFNIGELYLNAQGVTQDYAEAMRWFRKAADQGSADAQANIGSMYESGEGVPQDHAEAMRWFRMANVSPPPSGSVPASLNGHHVLTEPNGNRTATAL